jgi:hypothetical protein
LEISRQSLSYPALNAAPCPCAEWPPWPVPREQFHEHFVRGVIVGFGEAFPEQAQIFTVNVFIHAGHHLEQERQYGIWHSKVVVKIEQPQT